MQWDPAAYGAFVSWAWPRAWSSLAAAAPPNGRPRAHPLSLKRLPVRHPWNQRNCVCRWPSANVALPLSTWALW